MSRIIVGDKRLPEMPNNLHNFGILPHIEETVKALEKVQKLSQELDAKMRASMYPDALKRFQEAINDAVHFSSLQKQMDAFVKTMQNVEEFSKRIQRQNEDEKAAFQATGWWMSPKLLDQDVRVINRAVHAYSAGDANALDEMFLSIFEKDGQRALNEMIDSWEANPLFKEWVPIIDDARKAHIEGRYRLSVPALLLAIEGIARNLAQILDVYNDKRMHSKPKAVIESVMTFARARKPDLDLTVDYFLEALKIFLYNGDRKAKKGDISEELPNILNRHMVMHGRSTTYGTVSNSLRCFMVLDVLNIFDQEEVKRMQLT